MLQAPQQSGACLQQGSHAGEDGLEQTSGSFRTIELLCGADRVLQLMCQDISVRHKRGVNSGQSTSSTLQNVSTYGHAVHIIPNSNIASS